ncbi:MAG: hypothetical protein IKT44_00990 [Clostridia bacterium]|nr:hypothetical protein [Clostridia bacterium]
MKKTLKYFLAANSCEGFVSHFGDCYNPHDNWKAYIIKGGPGTGKSSFMKRVAKSAEERDEKYILCPCSSDPQSLDAVILPDKKTVILDGTAPHTLDPVYPAVCEEILNFGQFWDSGKIGKSDEIITVTDQNKALHKTAAKYLNAAGQIMLDSYKIALSCTKKAQVKTFAEKMCKKYIPHKSGTPYEWVAFLGGITPNGIITYPETVINSCENLVIISDKFHTVSNGIMNEIRNYCLINGYEIIAIKNPFLPTLLTDHIIIPELSLAFVTETQDIQFEYDARRIHSRRFTSNKMLHNSKERLKLNRKITKSLLDSASNTLDKAKAVHDKLESYYINAMDFEALDEFTEKFCKKVFA